MRKALFIFFILCSSLSYAHDYYFAFAEVEYSELNGELQATLIVSTHDIEKMLRDKGIIHKDLSSYTDDSLALINIRKEIINGFSFKMDKLELELTLEGMEVQLTGLTNFYFSVKNIFSIKEISVKFDLLMDTYTEQQNKLTFIYRNFTNTYVFFSNNKEQDLILTEK